MSRGTLLLLCLTSLAWSLEINLVTNGGFEEGARGWHLAVPPGFEDRVRVVLTDAHSGRRALLMDATGLPHEVGAWSDPIPVRAGTRYRFRTWVRQIAGYTQYKAVIDWRDAEGKHLQYANNWKGNDWPTRYSIHGGDFLAPAGATQAVLLVGVAAGSACLMDDFSLCALPPTGPLLTTYLWSEPAEADGRYPVMAWFRNDGDRPSAETTATLSVPPGFSVAPLTQRLPAVHPGDRVRLRWTIQARTPTRAPVTLRLGSPVALRGQRTTSLFVTRGQVTTLQSQPVPAPESVPSKPLVGAYYFPVMLDWERDGWGVRHVDYLTPMLGYYDEALPEVADWHILWAVEHGVSFFAYDWYYNDGTLYLNDALEKGFLRARHRGLMKFCINWCNEGQATWDRPLNYSTESLCQLMRYWCRRYLRRPEYLRVEGRPLLMIIRPDVIIDWHGGPDGSRRALNAMREVARRHGVGEVLLMCIGLAERAHLYRQAGYDAITAYSYGWGDAPRYPNNDCDYDDLLWEHHQAWQRSLRGAHAGGLRYMPVVWTGWDDFARARDRVVRTRGNTAGIFREMCHLAKRFVDPPLNLLIIEAWNEWGEGSVLEPGVERGFAFLDAVRDIFTRALGPHPDPVPAHAWRQRLETTMTAVDVNSRYIRRDRLRRGTGPIRIPHWTFDAGDFQGWHRAGHITALRVEEGCLQGIAVTPDPALFGPELMDVTARDWSAIEIRLRVDAGHTGQLFWRTEGVWGFSEQASIRFPLQTDGAWHTVRLPVGNHPEWSGTIRQLRLDPTDVAGAHFAIDEIRGI